MSLLRGSRLTTDTASPPQHSVPRLKKFLLSAVFLALIFSALSFSFERGSLLWLVGGLSLLAILVALAPFLARSRLRHVRIPLGPALLVLSLGVSAILGEFTLQLFFFQRFQDDFSRYADSLHYRYDSRLGWVPVPRLRLEFGSATVANNSDGFRAPEFLVNEKPGIVFLGDSFVWGYRVEASERFTEKIQGRHPEWNVFNFGVSGYGTDQEFLLLQRQFDRVRPRLVFLVFCCENDEQDNSTNLQDIYYKPYYVVNGTALALKGVPVPECERAFWADHPVLHHSLLCRLILRVCNKFANAPQVHNPNPTFAILAAMHKYLSAQGCAFAVGLTTDHPQLEAFLSDSKIPFLKLSTSLRFSSVDPHWTPEGHTFVCSKIEDFIHANPSLLSPQ